jgi:acyl-CoA thioester hydrolase
VPDKLGFMVASSQCQFKKPLHYPAEINVCARVDWAKNSSFQISYKIEKGEQLIAEGMDVIVVFDHRKKTKVTIPGSVRQKMEDIEKRILNLPD